MTEVTHKPATTKQLNEKLTLTKYETSQWKYTSILIATFHILNYSKSFPELWQKTELTLSKKHAPSS